MRFKYQLGDIVSVYDKSEKFRILAFSEDYYFYRLVGLESASILRVNEGAVVGKVFNYHSIWDDLCRNE